MVMVGKHGPGFEASAEIAGHGEKATMQNAKSFATAKMMGFKIRADGKEICAPLAELVQWRMWPRGAGCFHALRMADWRKNGRTGWVQSE